MHYEFHVHLEVQSRFDPRPVKWGFPCYFHCLHTFHLSHYNIHIQNYQKLTVFSARFWPDEATYPTNRVYDKLSKNDKYLALSEASPNAKKCKSIWSHLSMVTDSCESYHVSAVNRCRENAIFGIISAANVAEYYGELHHPIFHCARHVCIHCNWKSHLGPLRLWAKQSFPWYTSFPLESPATYKFS